MVEVILRKRNYQKSPKQMNLITINSRTFWNITHHFCWSCFLFHSLYIVTASNNKPLSLYNMARLLPFSLAATLSRLQLKVGQHRCYQWDGPSIGSSPMLLVILTITAHGWPDSYATQSLRNAWYVYFQFHVVGN